MATEERDGTREKFKLMSCGDGSSSDVVACTSSIGKWFGPTKGYVRCSPGQRSAYAESGLVRGPSEGLGTCKINSKIESFAGKGYFDFREEM